NIFFLLLLVQPARSVPSLRPTATTPLWPPHLRPPPVKAPVPTAYLTTGDGIPVSLTAQLLSSDRRGGKRKRETKFKPIAVYGDAGVDHNLPPQRREKAKQLLTHCFNLGIAVDVVRQLETDPLFNSGRGSALTAK
ncbi:L-asparaginase, partial [Trifolium pratense]